MQWLELRNVSVNIEYFVQTSVTKDQYRKYKVVSCEKLSGGLDYIVLAVSLIID